MAYCLCSERLETDAGNVTVMKKRDKAAADNVLMKAALFCEEISHCAASSLSSCFQKKKKSLSSWYLP